MAKGRKTGGRQPGSQNKATAEIKSMARQYTAEALAALVRALDDPDKYVAAAIAILDRGYGKPAQTVGGDTEQPLIHRIESVIVRPAEDGQVERCR